MLPLQVEKGVGAMGRLEEAPQAVRAKEPEDPALPITSIRAALCTVRGGVVLRPPVPGQPSRQGLRAGWKERAILRWIEAPLLLAYTTPQ